MAKELPPKSNAARMSFFDHLAELRRRLAWSVAIVAVMAFVSFEYAPEIFTWLRQPLALLPRQSMTVLGPLEMFATYIKLAIIASLFVSAPFLMLQIWLFVAPGLLPSEKRWILPFIILGSVFFVGGGAFAYYAVLPTVFKYLVAMVPEGVEAHYSVSAYVSLVLQLLLAFGAVFELPLLMWILSAAGFFSPEAYAGFRKYWVVLAALIGGILTPTPDPFTQMMMAIPLMIFFELGIMGARFIRYRRQKNRVM